MNIFILDSNYKRIGVLSNQGVNPKAPYFDDLYTQELETSADTFYFSALSTSYTQDILEIGNHVTFEFNNQQKLFVISSLEFEHKEGMNVIGVYAEGAGFELLETYKKDIKLEQCNYSQFLDKILEDTGWKYEVSSSLANNLQDVEYTQEKNVYAMLQDSMQTFQGVELEFEADYKNGALVKTIHAYGNGERGSFVGERFEYGKNVKGIVKTQEVSNIKDEDIIFYEGLVTINGLQVEITYDVDFALKSVEVPEYGIGDTHYIIDNDFDPPMNIKGRIGKIEISFSDPTKNKIYLANFKKITGSKSEDTKEDDIKDIIDDYIGDGDGPYPDDPYPDEDDIRDLIEEILDERDDGGSPSDVDMEDLTAIEVNTGLLTVPLDEYNANKYGVPDESIYPGAFIDKQDLLDFIMNEINICTHIHTTVEAKYRRQGIPNFTDQTYLGIEPKIEFNNNPWYFHGDKNSGGYDSWDTCTWKSRVGQYIVRKDVEDIDGDGDVLDPGEHKTHCYNLPSLVAALLGAFQKHAGDELLHSGTSDGGIDLSDYATIVYVNEAIERAQLGDENGEIDLSNYATITYVDDKVGYMERYVNNSHNRLNDLIVEKTNALDKRVTKLESNSGSNPGEGTIPEGDTITVKKIIGGNSAYGEIMKYVEFEDSIYVKQIFGPEDQPVHWLSDIEVEGDITAGRDVTVGGDLHVYGQIINENGASVMSINNQEYYEEELRIRDEKIASLEARLAKIEEMLGINNN